MCAYVLWLNSDVLTEFLHALWTHDIVTAYSWQTSVSPHISTMSYVL